MPPQTAHKRGIRLPGRGSTNCGVARAPTRIADPQRGDAVKPTRQPTGSGEVPLDIHDHISGAGRVEHAHLTGVQPHDRKVGLNLAAGKVDIGGERLLPRRIRTDVRRAAAVVYGREVDDDSLSIQRHRSTQSGDLCGDRPAGAERSSPWSGVALVGRDARASSPRIADTGRGSTPCKRRRRRRCTGRQAPLASYRQAFGR
jgi:hypothetical protein